jgi:hypothetical protein
LTRGRASFSGRPASCLSSHSRARAAASAKGQLLIGKARQRRLAVHGRDRPEEPQIFCLLREPAGLEDRIQASVLATLGMKLWLAQRFGGAGRTLSSAPAHAAGKAMESLEHLVRSRIRMFLRNTWLVTILGTAILAGGVWLAFYFTSQNVFGNPPLRD